MAKRRISQISLVATDVNGQMDNGQGGKFLSSMALRLACGLQNFEVITSTPWTPSHISYWDYLIWTQLTGKYTMSMKGTKQKLKRRAAKAMKGNPALMGGPAAIGEKTTVGNKTSQHPAERLID